MIEGFFWSGVIFSAFCHHLCCLDIGLYQESVHVLVTLRFTKLLCYQLPKRKSWKTGLLTPPKETAAARAVRLVPRLGYSKQGQVRFHPFCGLLYKSRPDPVVYHQDRCSWGLPYLQESRGGC